jgi:anti-sigma-K factor RskA
MNTPRDDMPDDDLLAAELALGLLDGEARISAATRMRDEPAFAQRVAAWEARFAPWLVALPDVDAPESAWPRIRQALWQHGLPARAAIAPASSSLWDRLPFWRGLAAGGLAVAAASLGALMLTVRSVPERLDAPTAPVATVQAPARGAAAPMAVSLLHDDGSAAYNAVVNPDTGVIVLVPVHMPDDARVPELWLIGSDGVPKSLGVVARDRAMQIRIPEPVRTAAEANAVFAVSMEPEGGSPTGLPTGPVIAKGSLIAL